MATRRIEAFLTYNERDREAAAKVDEWLIAHGVETHFWEKDVAVGDPVSEEQQLLSARTVVVLLGSQGWGPTHIQQVRLAAARHMPLLPVLIGDASAEALEDADGLFKDQKYLDLRSGNVQRLTELVRRIKQLAAPGDGRVDYLINRFIDGSDDQRNDALSEIQRGKSFDHAALAARLRIEIDGRFGPRPESSFGAAPRDNQKIGSIRSWMISALLWSEPESPATQALVLRHIGPAEEPDRNVRFWTLAGAYFVRASYLSEATDLATRDDRAEISDLAKAIGQHPKQTEELRTKLESKNFETAWQALRALRVAAVPALVGDICRQLLRVAGDTALAYDVLYAASNPSILAEAAALLSQTPGVEAVVDVVVDTAIQSNDTATRQFAHLLAAFDRNRVNSVLDTRVQEPRAQHVIATIFLVLDARRTTDGPQPASMPGFNSDTAGDQSDQLDIRQEVATFAAIMMAREVEPPLAIGLFGDWGSGKSFFMNSLIATIDKIATRSRSANTSPFCGNVVQIKFNAWHYVDTQLWPSLVTFILEKLAAYVSPKQSVTEQHAELLAELDSAKARTKEIESEKVRASELLARDEVKLTEIRTERMNKELALADIRTTDVLRLLARNPQIKAEVSKKLESAGLPGAVSSIEDLDKAVDEARRVRKSVTELVVTTARQKSWPLYVSLLVLVIVAAPGMIYLQQRYASQIGTLIATLSAMTAQVVAFLATAVAWLRKGTQVAQANLEKIQSARVQVEQLITDKRNVISQAEKDLSEEVERLKLNEQQAEARLAAASAHVIEIESRLKSFKEAGSLARFLSDRTSSDDYRKHLGLISLVRQDFEALSERISNQQLLGPGFRPVERIVLYIDDLDRCPAQNVVEVLQAVHLLLAYRLFVVVVGVDSRWLLNSLASHYAEFRGEGRKFVQNGADLTSTPQHYLEKIFQIPYSLRPMNERGFSRLIGHVMRKPGIVAGAASPDLHSGPNSSGSAGPSDEASPSGPPDPSVSPSLPATPGINAASPAQPVTEVTKPVELKRPPEQHSDDELWVREEALIIQPWEIQFAQTLYALIPSPRAAKRLSNTYRILKARVSVQDLALFEGTDGLPGHFQVPLLLLAMLIYEPNTVAGWFPVLQGSAAEYSSIAEALGVAIERSTTSRTGNDSTTSRAALAARVRTIVTAPTFPVDTAILADWIPHVARFSFDLSRSVSVSP